MHHVIFMHHEKLERRCMLENVNQEAITTLFSLVSIGNILHDGG